MTENQRDVIRIIVIYLKRHNASGLVDLVLDEFGEAFKKEPPAHDISLEEYERIKREAAIQQEAKEGRWGHARKILWGVASEEMP